MVIGPKGEQMGTKKLADALTIANYAGLDLVLMNSTPGHEVGKIMDYNRYRYERQKKQKEALKKQRENNKEMKEYQLSVTIDVHDFETRRKNAASYLVKGHKIKASLRFKGRQMAHTELGNEVLERFASRVEDIADIEQKPNLDGRVMTMLLVPKKDKQEEIMAKNKIKTRKSIAKVLNKRKNDYPLLIRKIRYQEERMLQ